MKTLRRSGFGWSNGVVMMPVALIAFSLMFLVSLIAVSEAFQPQINQSSATDVDVSAKISPVVVLNVSENYLDLGASNVAASALTTRDLVVTVSTNNQTGYRMYINMKTTKQCLRRLQNQGASCPVTNMSINPLAGATAVGSFPENYWGVSVSPFANYYPVPGSTSTPLDLKTINTATLGDNTIVRVGAKPNIRLPVGDYYEVVVVSAVMNPIPVPVVTSISPTWGLPGTNVTMNGAYLDYIEDVRFDSTSCENLNIASSVELSCDAPDMVGIARINTASVFGQLTQNTPTFSYPEEFRFTIDTRMTDTLFADGDTPVTNPAHFSGTATVFYIPTYGTSGTTNYDWLIDWGDGTPDEHATGSRGLNGGIAHDYATSGGPGEYQITIKTYQGAYAGWLGPLGLCGGNYSIASCTQANRNIIKSIDTPFTKLATSCGAATNCFSSMFYQVKNAVGVPANLFSLTDTSGIANFSGMFYDTFSGFAYNSKTATIPAGLFDFLSTSNATNMSSMFRDTFMNFAYSSTNATIPTGLFDSLNMSKVSNVSTMFYSTFQGYGYNSISGTIPPNLLSFINISGAPNPGTFLYQTFMNYAYANTSSGTDINSIWGGANFGGRVTAANAGGTSGVFYNTFNNMRSLTGQAQIFIDNYLGGINPTTRASTFAGTQVTDLASLDANWK